MKKTSIVIAGDGFAGQRATRTCKLAGFAAVAEVDRDLVEWNYGEYEGLRTSEIREKRPDWDDTHHVSD
jgi:broad specificity phosphatase PhoE